MKRKENREEKRKIRGDKNKSGFVSVQKKKSKKGFGFSFFRLIDL